MIRLYDTARRAVVPLELRDPGKVSIYVCGPTVYGPPHLGHGRMALAYDILRRYLTYRGLDVTFVSNITDIDDKIIERAASENRPWQEITEKCEAIWWDAMDAINVQRPDLTPHATDYVDQMVQLISDLVDLDRAYVTSDGVYLSVETVEGYGLLTHQSIDDLVEGAGDRAVVGTEKRHPADFALWKFAKEGEPAWPSPWGDGRPGWHTECVVMSLDLLGEGFDLHTGGLDLVFPHHENERAQAVAMGRTFANHWMHNGFVELEGEKMSKSLGNVKNLLDLAEQFDRRAYRLLVLQSHYRSPIEITDTTLRNAEAALDRLDAFGRRAGDLGGTPDPEAVERFTSVMDDDLDTPGAVDQMFRLIREANTLLDEGAPAADAAAGALLIADTLGLVINLGGDE
eukprot:snap_masked-scaffold5004_size5125-processed-gene-0.0 protein:Tk05344 transcript:snap_masked-scaffold5004_size5125-processed-gene-0.0-mRNA-1 annotation:"cysteinyl-trna synthetase"